MIIAAAVYNARIEYVYTVLRSLLPNVYCLPVYAHNFLYFTLQLPRAVFCFNICKCSTKVSTPEVALYIAFTDKLNSLPYVKAMFYF